MWRVLYRSKQPIRCVNTIDRECERVRSVVYDLCQMALGRCAAAHTDASLEACEEQLLVAIAAGAGAAAGDDVDTLDWH